MFGFGVAARSPYRLHFGHDDRVASTGNGLLMEFALKAVNVHVVRFCQS